MGSTLASLAQLNENIDLALSGLKGKVERASVSLSGTIDGLYPGQSAQLIINNYDSNTNYAVAASSGFVSITENEDGRATLAYEASEAGEITLTVGDRTLTFTVNEKTIGKPVIVNPTEGQVDMAPGIYIAALPFVSFPSGEFTHSETDWQIATDMEFTDVVWDNLGATDALDAIPLPEGLDGGVEHFARVRYVDRVHSTQPVYSEWSDPVSFTTAVSGMLGVEISKLLASDGVGQDQFGYAVSISGDGTTAIVGAHQDGDNGTDSGSAYIYRLVDGSWIETKLLPSDGAVDDFFGTAVSISEDGTTVIVGAHYDDDNGNRSGSAYIYRYDGSSWVETKLLPSVGATTDYFGYAVSISGDGTTAIVGAYNNDDNGSDSGCAYIYQYDGSSWVETKLTASDAAAGDKFGYAVSISGDGTTAIVGAQADDDNGKDSGSAYIYRLVEGSWVEAVKLTASDGATYDYFGNAVSISGNGTTAIVGAYTDDDNGDVSGSAYIYQYDGSTWVETKLTASDGAAGDYFGKAVSISGNGATAIVSAYRSDGVGADSGSVYAYQYNGSTWVEAAKLTASDAAASDQFGFAVSISEDGTTAIVSAPYDDDKGGASGSAYIFK